MKPLIQRLAEAVGATEPVNGSWLYAAAGGNAVGSADIWGSIMNSQEFPLINANSIQSIAEGIGITEPVNGSWLEAIVLVLEEGPIEEN